MPDWLSDSLLLTAWGMGLVFLMLGLLWLVISVLARLDVPKPLPQSASGAPAAGPVGLDPALVAAVMIAVRAHVRVRRKQAAPAMRTHPPGSLPSRWTFIGRGRQMRGG